MVLELALNRTVASVKEEYLASLPAGKVRAALRGLEAALGQPPPPPPPQAPAGVRLFFMGRECPDESALDHCSVTANCVITAMARPPR